jgi:hypothetical protein
MCAATALLVLLGGLVAKLSVFFFRGVADLISHIAHIIANAGSAIAQFVNAVIRLITSCHDITPFKNAPGNAFAADALFPENLQRRFDYTPLKRRKVNANQIVARTGNGGMNIYEHFR